MLFQHRVRIERGTSGLIWRMQNDELWSPDHVWTSRENSDGVASRSREALKSTQRLIILNSRTVSAKASTIFTSYVLCLESFSFCNVSAFSNPGFMHPDWGQPQDIHWRMSEMADSSLRLNPPWRETRSICQLSLHKSSDWFIPICGLPARGPQAP